MSHYLVSPAAPEAIIASIEEYIRALKSFDWFYDFSDDHRVYKRGYERMSALRSAQRSLDPEGTIWKQYEKRV